MSDWQPIETAPKDGRYVLVYCGDDALMDMELAFWDSMEDGGRGGWNSNRDCAAVEPTHWMPLPNPPKTSTPPLPPQAVPNAAKIDPLK